MFSKSTSNTLQKSEFLSNLGENRRSILHKDVSVKGDWTSDGVIEFSGKLVGNLTADVLVLTAEGQVTGNIRARKIIIEGQLKGTISALNVVVKSSAKIVADIKAEQLSIESGAEIQGHIQV
ncbi:MAG: polymer-forming cytoskeletal protein [Octadecabacter sp.]|nr:polymer-forming cytoskeletal protein [Octadecabacter sp.]